MDGCSHGVPGIIRQLGAWENIIKRANDHCMDNLSYSLWIVSKQPLTEDIVFKASQRLSQKVTNLRLRIHYCHNHDELKVPVWIESNQNKIDMEVLYTSDWIKIISQEWRKNFDFENGPIWRVKFLPNVSLGKRDAMFKHESIVILSWPHAILDGMSCQRIFGYFLDCLEDIQNNVTENPMPIPLLPAIETYLGLKKTMSDGIFEKILTVMFGSPLFRRFVSYMASVPIPIGADPTLPKVGWLVPIEITKNETRSIIRSCKARNLTVHPVLHAAAFIAFVKLFPETGKNMKINSFCPVDLRRRVENMERVKDMIFGCYMYAPQIKQSMNSDQTLTSETFWALAKDCYFQISTHIQEKSYLKELKTMCMLSNAMEGAGIKLQDILTCGRYGSFVITNMGKCDYLTRSDDSNFKLVGRFGGGGEQEGGAIVTNDLNTFNDQIYWGINYARHVITDQKVKDYARWIKEILAKYCSETCV